jgi:hypothetical protein
MFIYKFCFGKVGLACTLTHKLIYMMWQGPNFLKGTTEDKVSDNFECILILVHVNEQKYHTLKNDGLNHHIFRNINIIQFVHVDSETWLIKSIKKNFKKWHCNNIWCTLSKI